jgi:uncharacterized protein (TIGR03435 family)
MNAIVALFMAVVLQAPQFEVVSIKPRSGVPGPSLIEMPPTGRVNLVNVTLRTLLRSAYRLQDYQIVGGPDWLNGDRFDIQAKPSADYQPQPPSRCFGPDCPLTPVQFMLQGLLADRFQLKVHFEKRELPVYDLTTARSGFKLKPVVEPLPREPGAALPPPPPPPPPGTAPPTTAAALPTPPPGIMMGFPFGFAASGIEFSGLRNTLSDILNRPVIDKTGIKGFYDFKIVYSREGLPSNGPPPPVGGIGPGTEASDPRPSIFTAVQEQFGLKLDSSKAPVQVLVIDSVSKPTEN